MKQIAQTNYLKQIGPDDFIPALATMEVNETTTVGEIMRQLPQENEIRILHVQTLPEVKKDKHITDMLCAQCGVYTRMPGADFCSDKCKNEAYDYLPF